MDSFIHSYSSSEVGILCYDILDGYIDVCSKEDEDNPIWLLAELKSLKHLGMLFDVDGIQFIQRHYDSENGLPYSARVHQDGQTWQLDNVTSILSSGDSFAARVSIQAIQEIDEADDYADAIKTLYSNLHVEEELQNDQLEKIESTTENVESCLQASCNQVSEDLAYAENLLELRRIAKRHKFEWNSKFMKDIRESESVLPTMKTAIAQYAEDEKKLNEGKGFFTSLFVNSKAINRKFAVKWIEIIENGLEEHKERLNAVCPPTLKALLAKINDDCILFVMEADLKLFADLINNLNKPALLSALPRIAENYFASVGGNYESRRLRDIVPLTNRVFLFICKSLQQITEELKDDLSINTEVITYGNGRWIVTVPTDKGKQSALAKCLQCQLTMLVQLANHFEPGSKTIKQRFPYVFKIFKGNNILPTEMYVWLCLMDYTMHSVLQGNSMIMGKFSDLLVFYTTFVSPKGVESESLESLRAIAHNSMQFLVHANMCIEKDQKLAIEILRYQMSYLKDTIHSATITFNMYRDLIEVFTSYWKNTHSSLCKLWDKLPGDHFKPYVDRIQKKFIEVIVIALGKKGRIVESTHVLRIFEEFLIDLNDLDLAWYVKLQGNPNRDNCLQQNVVELVDNKWKGSDQECHRVTQMEKFVSLSSSGNASEVPKYYQLLVIETFLEFISSLGTKTTWSGGLRLTEEEQLNAMSLLIASIRGALPYLKEQPDYVDFDKFFQETVKPFSNVIQESVSFENFSKRISLIKDSFWYIRNQNSIGVNEALRMFRDAENTFNEEILRSTFDQYLKRFEQYMNDNIECDTDAKVRRIVADVKAKTEPQMTGEWERALKRQTIPEVLAGLAAVWSIKVSEDVATSGKYLKPHTIQILCVLRLMSVEKAENGVDKHLAQVLTGQGKSVILGLSAALLALFGHQATVVCYSKYLAERDENDFNELFSLFAIDKRISYKTFGGIASEQLGLFSAKARNFIYKNIGLSSEHSLSDKKGADLSNSVLLIDEVDVFFMDMFYGQTCNQGFFPNIDGLGEIQKKIWQIISEGCSIPQSIQDKVMRFIAESNHEKICKLKSFIERPQSYKILIDKGHCSEAISYTNKTLFSEHLGNMIYDAINVEHRIKEFKLKNGQILMRDEFGEYRRYYRRYYNTFAYFKLKVTNFEEHVDGNYNYGYLNMDFAQFSYAKIPEGYPLILGVTGTLTGLNTYEKNAVKNHYKIQQNSIMPSFFGTSNLKFDKKENIKCALSEKDWMRDIFTRINAIINGNQSVLVFFETDEQLDNFKSEFGSQLDRLNVLTANTEPDIKEQCINDAGVTKTVTLATREMGRGVDFKSSVTVEKNGGVHVIQTFFSLDVKEETQIKGRTARKDHRGSYELVVCLEHLVKLKLITGNTVYHSVNYDSLSKARNELADKSGADIVKQLEIANAKHTKSIEFYCGV